MVKKLFILLAILALAFCWFSPDICFSAGLPFYRATLNERQKLNEVLSTKIQQSLDKDKDGNKKIADGYFTPQMLLGAIQKSHPSAKLNLVSELPQYVLNLSSQAAPHDKEHKLARILDGKIDLEGWKRKFFADELVWVDINTGEMILSGYCANLIILDEKKPPEPVTEFEFCSKFVAGRNEKPAPPFRICSVTEFVELNWPSERVPVVYGICDSQGRNVYSQNVEITFTDVSSKGNNLVQSNSEKKLNREEGCTLLMVKRGNDYKTLDPFDPEGANGGKSQIIFSADGTQEKIEKLSIPWEVDVKDISQNEELTLEAEHTSEGISAKVSAPSGNFVPGVFSLVKTEGRRDRVIFRTNPLEDGSYIFKGNIEPGKYIVFFLQPELTKKGEIYLKEKKAIEIEIE